ncbi:MULTISPECIES: hypothetical protein [unclassified Shewanella]|uniref:hypothetical protein n=1 Tax=unclassified Shewanella TaxID=196818 RepID=UPI001BBBB7E0|nr:MULTISPECIES: hypothetical protein [unclassified Shewanella]GIU13138.1 hypothetical protein TUM4444_21270 [Shewanella sp. MBTL60-112-B1]GIU27112.1 hypothetical protein TUM4445_06920 [Shewanella sp. MBTL60-112-B2]
MKLIKALWYQYIQWCDSMGLTPSNRRSCAPRLADPELKPTAKLESGVRDRASLIKRSTQESDNKPHNS